MVSPRNLHQIRHPVICNNLLQIISTCVIFSKLLKITTVPVIFNNLLNKRIKIKEPACIAKI